MSMKDNSKKTEGRGRPKLAKEGGIRFNVHLTPKLMDALKQKTKEVQKEFPKKKQADVVRVAIQIHCLPPGKRRMEDPYREPTKE